MTRTSKPKILPELVIVMSIISPGYLVITIDQHLPVTEVMPSSGTIISN
jgi:hypothetical protein